MSWHRSLVLVVWQILFKLLWTSFDTWDLDFWPSVATSFTSLTRCLNSTNGAPSGSGSRFFNLAENGLAPKDASSLVLVWNLPMIIKTMLEVTIVKSADGGYLALCLGAGMTITAADKPTQLILAWFRLKIWHCTESASQAATNLLQDWTGPDNYLYKFKNFPGLNGVDKASEVYLTFSEGLFPNWHLLAHGCQAATTLLEAIEPLMSRFTNIIWSSCQLPILKNVSNSTC